MGHTNSTANLALPQFIGTDKPTWLGDVNGAFAAIDGYVGTNDAAVAAAASDASSAISQASAAVNTANTANTTAGNASTAANNAIGVANTANAIAGTVDAKVGLLADLNTTDRTSIVNAINEVNANAGIIQELWVNADISQAFAEQDVVINGDFDSFIISAGETTGAVMVTLMAESEQSGYFVTYGLSAGGILNIKIRNLSISKVGSTYTIHFGDSNTSTLSTYGSAPAVATDNNHLIPYRILGVVHQ